ncbi:MAG TPA: hypothetical protein PLK12_17695, partial [Prolixibacteraceae bacterium]|nr:hypothetical protein [Prolixibacteraceae bacterium]
MKAFPKPNIRKWLRIIHRDLGYFTLGITLVYAFSGIILNHKKNSQDPAYKTLSFEQTIERSLKPSEVDSLFALLFPSYELKKILPENNRYSLFLKGGLGWYEPESGRLWLEVYRRKPFVY